MDLLFVLNSMALGVGLAMDAFSVSLANGLHEPQMNTRRMFLIAGTFGAFQTAMPLTGWVCVHTLLNYFNAFSKAIPYIALVLLCWIGGKMLAEGIIGEKEEAEKLGGSTLFVQGVATSIDALSVGFTIAEYGVMEALTASLIIGLVTLAICLAGLQIGKTVGTRISGKASILGGVILIAIGLEIFLKGIL